MYISCKTVLRILCLTAAAFLLLVCLALKFNVDRLDYERRLENTYLRALGEITGDINAVSLNLEKAAYAGNGIRITSIYADISRHADNARFAIGGLPVDDGDVETAYNFLANVREFAEEMLWEGSSQNAGYEALLAMSHYAQALGASFAELEKNAYSGKSSVGECISKWNFDIPQDDIAAALYSNTDYSHISETAENIPGISPDEAMDLAVKFAEILGVSAENLSDKGMEYSPVPSYVFGSGETLISVAKYSGDAANIISSRKIGEKKASVSSARNRAAKYLQEMSLTSMEETFYETSNGVCSVTFARRDGGVIFHTDEIKVSVALDDLSVVFYDARSYILNSQVTRPVQPTISREEAAAALNPALTVRNVRLAYKNDALAYEFLCESPNGCSVIVFVNAATALEEDILLMRCY